MIDEKIIRSETNRPIGLVYLTKGGFYRGVSYVAGLAEGPFFSAGEAEQFVRDMAECPDAEDPNNRPCSNPAGHTWNDDDYCSRCGADGRA